MSYDKTSAQIHDSLSHPVIDGDAHWLEPYPMFADYLATVGGGRMVDDYTKMLTGRSDLWYSMAPAERAALQIKRPGFWPFTAGTVNYTTVNLPHLFHDRLDELGIDFAIVYPSVGLAYLSIRDSVPAEMRQACSAAYNLMTSEAFSDLSPRMTAVATIPTNTPDEAIAELEFAVGELGMKGIVINGHTIREPVGPDPMPTPDFYALDSPYDYDPFWKRCVELGVAVTAHGTADRWSQFRSQNYVYNHIGFFAQANFSFCKAVTIGGVPRRFPKLRFAFLEGGVAYTANLYSDLVGHYKLRNREASHRYLEPTNIDRAEFTELWERYASPQLKGRVDEVFASINPQHPFHTAQQLVDRDIDADDFVEVPGLEEMTRWFQENYYFGCEAEDPTMAYAFDGKAGTTLNPLLGSDIGHFDVTVAADVLAECWELVDDGIFSEADFERVVFRNSAELHTAMNPDFYRGTVVERAVDELLATR